jgi:hypothetical protein
MQIRRTTLSLLPCDVFARLSRSKYVRHNQVDQMRTACAAHRELQGKLRAGRAHYTELLAQTRNLIKLLASESESKDKAI